MARAAATVDDLEAGTLPPVCAKTGEAADGSASLQFTSTPGWTWILLLFGIFPFLIARYFSTVRVIGIVPMSDTALRRGRAFTWTYRGFVLLGVLVVALGFAADASTVVLIGCGTLLGTVLFALLAWPFVWPTGRVSDGWVWLSFVDERFAEELERWYGDPS